MDLKKYATDLTQFIVPTILLSDGTLLTLDTTTKAAIAILQFAEDRRKIDIGEFLPKHIETLAQVFNTDKDTISRNLTPAEVIKTFLECLTYIAKVFSRVAKEYASTTDNPRPRYKKRVPIDAVL